VASGFSRKSSAGIGLPPKGGSHEIDLFTRPAARAEARTLGGIGRTQTVYCHRIVAKVVVVGSTNTDMTVRVPHIPAPGETVLGHGFRISGGGKGANQAVAAARAGGDVLFVTALGTDDLGDRAVENLAREGIQVDLIRRVSGASSGVALIFVDDAGENSIAVAGGANNDLRPADVEPLRELLQADDVLLVQLEIPLETVERVAQIASTQQVRTILNPAPARKLPDSLLASVAVITPNELEVEQLTDVRPTNEVELARSAATLHERGVRDVLITLGARGVFTSSAGSSQQVPGFNVDAIDTTAAGDVFNGALAVALVEGRSLRDSVIFANAAAALSVTRMGAQASAPLRREVEAVLASGVASNCREAPRR
jgi:ribokinase